MIEPCVREASSKHQAYRLLILGLASLASVCLLLRFVSIALPLPWFLHDPIHYFPLLLQIFLSTPLVVLIWCSFPSYRFLSAGMLVFFVLNLFLEVNLAPEATAPPQAREMRLLSYNLFQCTWASEAFVTFLQREKPDIVLLQEVTREFYEEHQMELRRLFRHVHHADELITAVNLEMLDAETIPLPTNHLLHRLRVRQEGNTFEVYNTHLTVPHPLAFYSRVNLQRRQIAQILDRLRSVDVPFLVGGDFNFPPHCTCYRELERWGTSARSRRPMGFGYTFPSLLPMTAIDHVFASSHFRILQFEITGTARLSDHFPICVRLVLEP